MDLNSSDPETPQSNAMRTRRKTIYRWVPERVENNPVDAGTDFDRESSTPESLIQWRNCSYQEFQYGYDNCGCSSCHDEPCRRMAEIGLDENGEPLPTHLRARCGAKNRKGETCQNPVIAGRTRCKYHGGMSTGPKTKEGKAAIAAAQRKRWAKLREEDDTDA